MLKLKSNDVDCTHPRNMSPNIVGAPAASSNIIYLRSLHIRVCKSPFIEVIDVLEISYLFSIQPTRYEILSMN